MRKVLFALIAFIVAGSGVAFSMDRVQWLYSQNPPSSWHNQYERQVRLGVGQWVFNSFGSANGYFSNLSVTPATGLNVTVGPTSANTLASLYQYLPDDSNPFGGPGATALPVDNTQITLQGLMTTAQAQNLGPLNPPGTSGQSIIYAIECKVNTVDTTSQTVNFVTSSGTVTSGSANRDRADQIFCQAKAGAAASSPVAPTIDTGYLGVSTVTVAYGASSITSGNISATSGNGFYGFARVASAGLSASLPVCTDTNTNVTTNGCNIPTTVGGFIQQSQGGTGASSVQGAGLLPTYKDQAGTLQTASTAHRLSFLVQIGVGGINNGTRTGGVCNTNSCVRVYGFSLSGNSAYSAATSYACTGVDLDLSSTIGSAVFGSTNTSGSVFELDAVLPNTISLGSSDHIFVTCDGT